MFILVNPKLGKIWSNSLTINNMYFRFNNHAYKIVARTTDDFGVTTETGIDWVYGNVAIHQYEHDKLGTPLIIPIVFKTLMQTISQQVSWYTSTVKHLSKCINYSLF